MNLNVQQPCEGSSSRPRCRHREAKAFRGSNCGTRCSQKSFFSPEVCWNDKFWTLLTLVAPFCQTCSPVYWLLLIELLFVFLFFVWWNIEEAFCPCCLVALLQLKHLVSRTPAFLLTNTARRSSRYWRMTESGLFWLTREKAGTNGSGGGRLERPGGLQDWKD